jgi:hypothetical protein
MAPKAGIDPRNLAEVGWGVVFAPDIGTGVRESLAELLRLRARQAAEPRYRELVYQPGESSREFLARHRAGPGPADPERVPYYLLLVGEPESIPFLFQRQLGVMRAVGRICFDSPPEYARYARGVVSAELGQLVGRRRVALFGVETPGDPATSLSGETLTRPLAQALVEEWPGWAVQAVVGKEATKARLGRLLGGADTPDLLFTSSHGLGFPRGDDRQRAGQGALLCGDWPGPTSPGRAIPPECYFAAQDVEADADVAGLIALLHASYSAGTPWGDDFALHAFGQKVAVAPRAFVALLPQRLLRGGALAVLGQSDRAWG